MSRLSRLLAAWAALLLAAPMVAWGHFVFIVPDAGGVSARVVMSETLEPDERVPVQIIANTRIALRTADGSETPLQLHDGGETYLIALPGEGTRVVRGFIDLGYTQRGDGPAHVLLYHPKTILGDAFDASATLGWNVPVELVPTGSAGNLRFELLGNGVAQADAEVTVILPDGSQQIVTTDSDGLTPVFKQTGRFGAWARFWQDAAGTRDGKPFVQVRHYATLVLDAGAASESPAEPAVAQVETLPPLPEATSSHGAVANDGWLYVYGGHIAPTHEYHLQAVSGQLNRVRLADLKPGADATWESLPGGRGLQGINLATHGDDILLVGGMEPQNNVGEDVNHRSFADVKAFNVTSKEWRDLPSLPEPRSSHDVVVIDDTLYVVGGWDLQGSAADSTWPDDMLTLDLADEDATWQSKSQPFFRRALIAANYEGKLYVIGGFSDENEISLGVDIYDPASDAWTTGPDLPGGPMNGFSPAACVLNDHLYASVGDGTLLRLSEGGSAWTPVTKATPRIVHRLVPDGDRLLIIGGAAEGDNFDLIEAVTPGEITESSAKITENAADVLIAAGQTHCPVMTDQAVGDNAVVLDYDGTPVKVCCELCAFKWGADPDAYARAETLPQLKGRTPERALEQVFCPVYPDRVVSERDPFVMHEGKKIHVFNEAARRRFEADPARYATRP